MLGEDGPSAEGRLLGNGPNVGHGCGASFQYFMCESFYFLLVCFSSSFRRNKMILFFKNCSIWNFKSLKMQEQCYFRCINLLFPIGLTGCTLDVYGCFGWRNLVAVAVESERKE
jgi:hypothetical protein